ncbi:MULTISPECIES: hypothetical protein [Streptomyces]|uniref:hypothetical protein n=1 Tax=Streptomyces TaxID=1883 RepID=UPI0013177E65|nr:MULTISPECIES: hypothetical protein [Streptomyces]QGZ47372.1 hypothetical protein GPZ77_02180 [Streptomyces sp. QHH-9511]GGT79888.1 hypothetical protein GCM10010272_24990 [Streptomyces lateritius]
MGASFRAGAAECHARAELRAPCTYSRAPPSVTVRAVVEALANCAVADVREGPAEIRASPPVASRSPRPAHRVPQDPARLRHVGSRERR